MEDGRKNEGIIERECKEGINRQRQEEKEKKAKKMKIK